MNDFMERAAMKTGSIAILCAILVHSLIGDGLAIGFANTTADALTTFVGVAGHKAFASISLVSERRGWIGVPAYSVASRTLHLARPTQPSA